MNKSTSRQVAVADIDRLGALGVIVIRLMMSIGDITLASQALGVWNEEERPARERVKGAARRYFVRLQIAHLYEALKIIDDIKAMHSLLVLCRFPGPTLPTAVLACRYLFHYDVQPS